MLLTLLNFVLLPFNGFNKKPNIISTNKKVQDQYQILMYSNGIATMPNSIEDITLNSRKPAFKRRIQSILLFYEVTKDIDTFKAAKNYKK